VVQLRHISLDFHEQLVVLVVDPQHVVVDVDATPCLVELAETTRRGVVNVKGTIWHGTFDEDGHGVGVGLMMLVTHWARRRLCFSSLPWATCVCAALSLFFMQHSLAQCPFLS
jgi:hypothetical protein